MKPLTALFAAYRVLTWKNDTNCIKNSGKDLVGERNSALTKGFELKTLKKIAALHKGGTVNDVMMGMTSVVMKKYLNHLGDT